MKENGEEFERLLVISFSEMKNEEEMEMFVDNFEIAKS